MKIFIAGASGAIGTHLVTRLVARGHQVVGTTRSQAKTGPLRALGAEPVVVDALDPDSVADAVARAALRHVEHAVTGITWADGIVLRYGSFYGPGTGLSAAPDAVMTEQIRKRRFPIIGSGDGVWSMVHIADAAAATVAAVEKGETGIYHVADDDPAPVRVWLPYLARTLGAGPPRRVPAWLARPLACEGAVDMMTRARGISSEKTKRELGWAPRHPSWRTGFIDGLS
ncbi:NAD(P)-dependent oxidoreductase [Microbispora sp. CSR-4]|uniref:NAD-dependent epimerase/dehydratase family protein n=1 Tax=Microbispora sp. CSR-4 TaxID=2592813 RepID=UPI0011C97D5E|nr:NAD-dependent epimerase/dehydratase family protein [Microbispora sp. CSR-4]